MSVVNYVRLRCPLEVAMDRYGRWIDAEEAGPPRIVAERDAIDLALSDGEWRGLTVFIYANGDWTVMEELSGGLAARPPESWLELAQGGDLVFGDCNDAVPYAELLVIERGRIVRHIVRDEQAPGGDIDVGALAEEAEGKLADWSDVMAWVEADAEALERPERGWLWIHRAD